MTELDFLYEITECKIPGVSRDSRKTYKQARQLSRISIEDQFENFLLDTRNRPASRLRRGSFLQDPQVRASKARSTEASGHLRTRTHAYGIFRVRGRVVTQSEESRAAASRISSCSWIVEPKVNNVNKYPFSAISASERAKRSEPNIALPTTPKMNREQNIPYLVRIWNPKEVKLPTNSSEEQS